MFWNKKPRRTMQTAVAHEVNGLCHQWQIETLSLGAHLRKDIGLDCGCNAGRPGTRHYRFTRP